MARWDDDDDLPDWEEAPYEEEEKGDRQPFLGNIGPVARWALFLLVAGLALWFMEIGLTALGRLLHGD